MGYDYADKLEFGDTIAVASGSFIDIGFFAGHGNNTTQYYVPTGITYGFDRAAEKGEQFSLKKHCYKAYVKCYPRRVIKITELTFGDIIAKQEYERAKQILIDIKFIKQ